MLRKSVIIIIILTAVIWLGSKSEQDADNYHSWLQLRMLRAMNIALPDASNSYFLASGHCVFCHGRDTLSMASVDTFGNDINVVDDWRSTMMANAAKDPFWVAKVSHEVLANPGYQQEIENTCTKCHAPMGHYGVILSGQQYYSMNDLAIDSVGRDGVSCGACHQVSDINLGNQFSGMINYDTNSVAYGPYPRPFSAPMIGHTGMEPVYSEHINDAGLCASCHTLITNVLDTSGNPTGNTFVEQATYHEWLNSIYNTDSTTCQSCHIPRLFQEVSISTRPLSLPPQDYFALHELAGGNTFMLKLLRNNIDRLGLTASEAQFDSTIAATLQMLQQKTLDLDVSVEDINRDTAFIRVELSNKAGHKFPSGYPSRRAFIQFVMLDENQDTIFKSGMLDSTYEVEGLDEQYEPHYNIINRQDQVQIYEMIQADVTGQFTTILDRAAYALKDNRLPPVGFTIAHPAYDTVKVVGHAMGDFDFNRFSGVEGTGKDFVHYHVPLNGYQGEIYVTASVLYQSLPPKWMEEIFSESTPAIDSFRVMYYENDQTPVLIGSASLDTTFSFPSKVDENIFQSVSIYPNPAINKTITIDNIPEEAVKVEVVDVLGKNFESIRLNGQSTVTVNLPEREGIYFVRLSLSNGETFTWKVLSD